MNPGNMSHGSLKNRWVKRPLLLLLRKIPQYSFSHFLIHHCYQREASLLIAVARLLPRLNPANCLDLDRLLDCPPFIRVKAVSCYYSGGTCGYHKLGYVSSILKSSVSGTIYEQTNIERSGAVNVGSLCFVKYLKTQRVSICDL